MSALVLAAVPAGALIAAWWWFEGSLRRECRRPLTGRDVAALADLEASRAAALEVQR